MAGHDPGAQGPRFSTRGAPGTPAGGGQSATKRNPAWAIAANLIFTFGMFIFMYKFVPLLLVTKLQKLYPALAGRVAFNVADGVIRMAIFLGSCSPVSLLKDIRRVFEYHGAEHKVVFKF